MATPPKNQVIQLGDYTDSNFETFLVFFTNLEFNKPKKISMKITNDNFNWKNSLRMKINWFLTHRARLWHCEDVDHLHRVLVDELAKHETHHLHRNTGSAVFQHLKL